MEIQKVEVKQRAIEAHQAIEERVNSLVRGYDRLMGRVGLGGRKGYYDDELYEFEGGAKDELRMKHYDKSLRLLWKAQDHAAWSSFRDSSGNTPLHDMAEQSLNEDEKTERKRINSKEYRDFLNNQYTQEQRQAIVNILSLIGHGEAYAWLVSTELLNEVRSTGARAASTMQVLEEAKHFVVLRELLQAFECPIPRLSAWEYVLLERGFKSKGLEKFFAMNVMVEGFALNIFGLMSSLPGLEILKLFHLDESRHCALPANYFAEFPMSSWEKFSPFRRLSRLLLLAPGLPVFIAIEKDLAVLGIDSLQFGGSACRKILNLADRVGFKFPMSIGRLSRLFNFVFNSWANYSREDHKWQDYMRSETTRIQQQREVEKRVFEMKIN